jgi:hypothetical protein
MKIDWKKEIKLPKLRRPSFSKSSGVSMPKLSRSSGPKPSRPKLPGPELHAPKFVTDLYADLRDRRLLPLVALLLVAIVAAPILLSGKGEHEEAAALTPARAAGAEASDATFSVVPAEPGLRDYKKRLGHRTPLNPFRRPAEEKKQAEESSETPATNPSSIEPSSSESGSSEPTATITIGGVTREIPASSVEVESSGSGKSTPTSPKAPKARNSESGSSTEGEAGPSTGGESGSSETAETTEPTEPAHTEASPTPTTSESSNPVQGATQEVVGYTIDAEAGYVPHATEKTGIAPMTRLPNAKHPVVLFMGLSKDHKRALFLMTSNVTAYYGGHCALDKQACQLVEVKPGKGVTFADGYGESRYKLHLKKIVPTLRFSK